MKEVKKMNIQKWIKEHENMKRDYFCDTFGNTDKYIYKYENGDQYRHEETQNTLWEKTIKDYINEKLVSAKNYKWENFGWKEIQL